MENRPLDLYGDVLTVEELMEVFQVGKNTAYGLVKDGMIKSIKIGKRYRIPKKYVREFIENYAS